MYINLLLFLITFHRANHVSTVQYIISRVIAKCFLKLMRMCMLIRVYSSASITHAIYYIARAAKCFHLAR